MVLKKFFFFWRMKRLTPGSHIANAAAEAVGMERLVQRRHHRAKRRLATTATLRSLRASRTAMQSWTHQNENHINHENGLFTLHKLQSNQQLRFSLRRCRVSSDVHSRARREETSSSCMIGRASICAAPWYLVRQGGLVFLCMHLAQCQPVYLICWLQCVSRSIDIGK